MKITPSKKKQSKKWFALSLIGAVILVGGVAAALYITRPQQPTPGSQMPTGKPQNNTPRTDTPGDNKSNTDDKQKFLDEQAEKEKNNGGSTPPVEQHPQIPPSITLSAKTDKDTVIITTNLSSTPSGSCKLTITGGTTPVTKTAQVIYNPEFSTCAGFSVAKHEVNAPQWTIKLDVSSPDGTQTKTITYTP